MFGESETVRMLNRLATFSSSTRTEVIVVRYNNVIRFYSEGKRRYNFQTSQSEGAPVLLLEVMGNVTDMGADRSKNLLDSITQGAKVVRLVEPVDVKWSYLTIDDSPKKYRLRTVIKPLKNYSLLVGEDVG